ncbi:MAG TPA: hypothetical protein VKU44_02030 [Terriglobia bacterium]|nr:hypothetical protein [Terriglobia bacterium]
MATFTVKLVDHTNSSDGFKQRIKSHIQTLFDQVFRGTSDSAIVDWGAGAANDAVVLHFVDDTGSSYIQQQWPGSDIRVDAGGHTRTRGNVTGSEFYKHDVVGGKRTMMQDTGYAKIVFHETLHNKLTGWTADQLHGTQGGGGLALLHPQLPMTDRNIALMRQGLAAKNAQLL